MKYKLVKKVTDIGEINSVLLNILSNQGNFFCDSVLETDDRIIVRYVVRYLGSVAKTIIPQYESIFYIHCSKKDYAFTKICIYKLEELINEKDIQKKN